MTIFFTLSGFLLFYNYNHKDLFEKESLFSFYKKRFISIAPTYFLIHILSILILDTPIKESLIVTPVDIFAIQSVFNIGAPVIHNGGTWFISCLMFGYLVYPLVQEVLKTFEFRTKIIVGAILFFMLVYCETIIKVTFGTPNSYANPIFRVFEFTLGAVIGAILLQAKEEKVYYNKTIIFSILFSLLLSFCFIIWVLSLDGLWFNRNGDEWVKFVWKNEYYITAIVRYPLATTILLLSNIKFKFLGKSFLIKYLSSISYYFYIIQTILWKIMLSTISHFKLKSNVGIIFLSFFLCMIMAILIQQLFDKPIKKFLRKKWFSPRKL